MEMVGIRNNHPSLATICGERVGAKAYFPSELRVGEEKGGPVCVLSRWRQI